VRGIFWGGMEGIFADVGGCLAEDEV